MTKIRGVLAAALLAGCTKTTPPAPSHSEPPAALTDASPSAEVNPDSGAGALAAVDASPSAGVAPDSGPALAAAAPECPASIAPDDPLGDVGLSSRARDPVADITRPWWSEEEDKYWIAEPPTFVQAGGVKMALVPVRQIKNAATLVVLREVGPAFCVVNEWTWAFGGKGVELEIGPSEELPDHSGVVVVLRALAYFGGVLDPPPGPRRVVALVVTPNRVTEGADLDDVGAERPLRLSRSGTNVFLHVGHKTARVHLR